MAFHLSTKEARGIIVGRAVKTRETDFMDPLPVRRHLRQPSGGGALLAATLLALLVKVFLADLAVVDGRSMEPFFSRGSIVLVIRCAYGLRSPGSEGAYWLRWSRPRPGDIVLAFPPLSGKRVVKRVTAVDSVGEVFLLGDNPPESRDSRDYGPVHVNDIVGKVLRLRR